MVDVNALLQGLDEQGALTPLQVGPDGIRTLDATVLAKLEQVRLLLAGTLEVDTSLAPVLAAGLDVRVVSQPAPRSDYPLPTAQVDALKPLATQPVSGSVTATVANFPATQVVSGTVSTGLSQPLTDTQLRASAVPVATGLTQPLTDAQLRASALPVSGPLTDAQLRASQLSVSTPDLTASGTITTADVASVSAGSTPVPSVPSFTQTRFTGTPTAGSVVALLTPTFAETSFSLDVAGTFVGTLQIERSVDGTTWTSVGMFVAGSPITTSTLTGPAACHGNASSTAGIRVRATSWTSGTATVFLRCGSGVGTLTVGNPVRLADPTTPTQQLGVNADGSLRQSVWNGTGWDAQRGNGDTATVLASAARNDSGQSAALTNFNARGVVLFVNTTAASGVGATLSLQVQGQDPVTGNWFGLHTAGANITAAGSAVLEVYPGATTAPPGTGSLAVSQPLPRAWRLAWTIGGTAPSFTFSVGASYVL